MNRIFKKIFNKSLGRMVVVSEHAKSSGKTDNTTGEQPTHLTTRSHHNVNGITVSPKFILHSLVVSIATISGGSVWAGEACDMASAGESSANSSSVGTNSFACGTAFNAALGESATAIGSSQLTATGSGLTPKVTTDKTTGYITSINGVAVVSTATSWSDLRSDVYTKLTSVAGKTLNAQQKQGYMNALTFGANIALGDQSSAMGVTNSAMGSSSSAVGNQNTASGSNSSAFGYGNTASSSGAINSAVGAYNTASKDYSSAVGAYNTASGIYSSAVGYGNTASGNDSSAVGLSNTASNFYSSVFGSNSKATHVGATALGNNSETDRENSISVGKAGAEKQITFVKAGTNDTDAVNLKQMTDAIAAGGGSAPIANDNYAQNANVTALGAASGSSHNIELDANNKIVSVNGIGVTATGNTIASITAINGFNTTPEQLSQFKNAAEKGGNIALKGVAVGTMNISAGSGAVAVGGGNKVFANYGATAIGSSNTTTGRSASAIGSENKALDERSTAVGYDNTASGMDSTAFGSVSTASGIHSTAMGYYNMASANNSSVFGSESIAAFENSTAIGYQSETDRTNSISVGKEGAEKQITFVKAGTAATDATNLKQVQDLIAASSGGVASSDNYTDTADSVVLGSASGSAYKIDYDENNRIIKVAGVDVTATGNTLDTITAINGKNVTSAQIAQFKKAAEKGGNIALSAAVASGVGNLAMGGSSTAMGSRNTASGINSSAVGSRNTASGINSSAVGSSNTASGQWGVAMGFSNVASGQWGVAVGSTNKAVNLGSTAVGSTNTAWGSNSTAVGANNIALGSNSTAVGSTNMAIAENSTVFGSSSKATHSGATALGNNSETDRDNSISVGKAGAEKQITFVKAGTNDTDAVNVAQLKTKMDQTDLSAGLATKADKTTFDTLNSKVNDATTGLDSKASKVDVTALTGRVITNEGEILTLQNGLDVLSTNAVVYDSAAKDSITLAGVNKTKLTHLKDAVLNDTSTDAVTGKQLYLTNNSVSVLNTRIDASNTAFVQGLGGGAAWNNGVFKAPTYTIQGQSKNNVGDALTLVDQQLNSIKTSVSNTVVDAKNYTDQKTVSALSDAKDYADQKAISTLNGAKDYTDQKAAATLSDAKMYGDQKANAALSDAKMYADQKAVDGKTYTDQKAAATLSDAKAYSDQKANTALSDAKTYADQKVADGKTYTDSKIVAVQQKIAENSQFVSINGTGYIASATGAGATAIGVGALARGNQSTAIGAGAQVTGQQSTAVGKGNMVSGNRSGAFGDPNTVTGNESYATGNDNTITSNSSHAVGNNNTIKGNQTVVLGNNVNTTAKNAVILGNDSASNRDDTVSVGAAGKERQIIHVAAGVQDTDAVNYQQLKASEKSANNYTNERVNTLNSAFNEYRANTEQRFQKVDERFNRQGAMSAAMMNMSSSAASVKGQNRIGVGAGFQGQEQAVSIGYQRIINENTSLTIGGAFTKDESSGGVGVGFGW